MKAHSRRRLIIAIDGPAGSGKSTVARLIAKKLKTPYIDTGAMYRAVTLKAMREKASFEDTKKLVSIAKKAVIRLTEDKKGKQKVLLDGKDVAKAIRLPELTKNVFYVAQISAIRREMVKKQRVLGKKGGAVIEGRDIGTVVFPKADHKFFLVADPTIRAMRRYKDLLAEGKKVDYQEVLSELEKRDTKDIHRQEGPLKQAKDAVLLDTSSLTIREVVDKILKAVSVRRPKSQG